MNMQIDKHIIDKINEAHAGVINSSKSAIEYAITAGKELTRVKEMCRHGEFLLIVNNSFDFSQDTAQRYMKCFEYSAKTAEVRNLQEAYKLIESEESKKKAAEAEATREKLAYRDKYGEKPNTWQRADDYAWKKLQEERLAREQRIADFKSEQNKLQNSKESVTNYDDEKLDEDIKRLSRYFETQTAKQETMLNLNIVNQNGSILDFISNYLDSLDTDSQRIEECHNIIKYCKNYSAKLQVVRN